MAISIEHLRRAGLDLSYLVGLRVFDRGGSYFPTPISRVDDLRIHFEDRSSLFIEEWGEYYVSNRSGLFIPTSGTPEAIKEWYSQFETE